MRKQDYIIMWPVYFDSSKSRRSGRRVPRSLATPSPKVPEIVEAAEKVGLTCETALDVSYPKCPWLKTGVILARKRGSKGKMIQRIARNLASRSV